MGRVKSAILLSFFVALSLMRGSAYAKERELEIHKDFSISCYVLHVKAVRDDQFFTSLNMEAPVKSLSPFERSLRDELNFWQGVLLASDPSKLSTARIEKVIKQVGLVENVDSSAEYTVWFVAALDNCSATRKRVPVSRLLLK